MVAELRLPTSIADNLAGEAIKICPLGKNNQYSELNYAWLNRGLNLKSCSDVNNISSPIAFSRLGKMLR